METATKLHRVKYMQRKNYSYPASHACMQLYIYRRGDAALVIMTSACVLSCNYLFKRLPVSWALEGACAQKANRTCMIIMTIANAYSWKL